MKPTLGQVFALSLIALVAILGLLFYVVFDASRAATLESSERLRGRVSDGISQRVTAFLDSAPAAARQFQLALNRGLVDPRDPRALEPALLAPLLGNPDIGEMTLTYGEKLGYGKNGMIELAPEPRGEWSAVRGTDGQGGDLFWTRHVYREGGAFVADRRVFNRAVPFLTLPMTREPSGPIPDPTTHLTFTTPAREDLYGDLLPSDIHYSQLDAALPEVQRRAEVSVQQAMTDTQGRFVGVLRVGLLTAQLDNAVHITVATGTSGQMTDPHRIFLCDSQGRLITRGVPTDVLRDSDGDLRIPNPPEPIARALADPSLRGVSAATPRVFGQFSLSGSDYMTAFSALPPGQTQDWIVGIVVPSPYYTGPLAAIRNRLLAVSLGIIAFTVAGGGLVLAAVKRAQARIVRQSLRMNAFEFAPAPADAAFRDVAAVLESIEKAKAAMRAMSKYVPIDLVRRLYREKSEPALGGEPMEISIMFTDIENFTPLAERLEPGRLAGALGRYLDTMARIIQKETRGTIDKYIGDAIMTIWNAPEPVADHARMACLAAVRCRDAGHELCASAEWSGLPPFETRFGLHTDTALVGHFGAHDRMNYTAIGDPVNLASRLEGLNKYYRTSIVASGRIVKAAGEEFAFRLLDLVAVKGKSEAIEIYELLGLKGAGEWKAAGFYEEAFEAYRRREFEKAAGMLEANAGDAPSAVLLERCRSYMEEPPPDGWRGEHIAAGK